MSQFNPGDDEPTDIWEAFDEAVERAADAHKKAWENYQIIQHTEEPLPEEYVSGLTEIDDAIQEFNSVYEVTDSQLDRAETVAANAVFLATVTQAYVEYHEEIIKRRVDIARKWYEALVECIEDAGSEIAADQSTLSQEMQALGKLTNAEKYGQLLESDRIELRDTEDNLYEFDSAVQEVVDANKYVSNGLELAESFQSRFKNDLSELVEAGVDNDAISVADRVEGVPELEPIATRLDDGCVDDEDITAVATAVETYAEVVRLTGKYREEYNLGSSLITAIENSNLTDEPDVRTDLHNHLASLQIEAIEDKVRSLVEGETTTSEKERLLQILSKHDGSVRQASKSLDRPTEEIFEDLQELFVQKEIIDMEAIFE